MKKIFKFIPLIVASVILYFLIYPNYHKIIKIYYVSSKFWLFMAFVAAMGSYFFMSLSLNEMLKIMGYKISFLNSFSITMISTTVNYFFSSAGASGFAIRTHLLNKKGIPVSICLSTSVVLTALIYLVLGLIIFQSFFLYFIEIRKLNIQIIEGAAGSFIVLFLSFFMAIIIYSYRFRNRWAIRIFYFINSTLYQITKYQIPKEDFRDFKNKLNHGINILHKRKYELPKVMGYVLLDWMLNIIVLYFAFLSINIKIPLLKLIIGFSFGMVMTIIPVLPSGLGAMEVVISGFYSNCGIPLESAIFASLVFRIFYYIIPSIISMVMFYGMKIVEPDIDRDDLDYIEKNGRKNDRKIHEK
ncbi:MAG: flippase-like domain-containing protein [Elusimicrobiota bacterium]